MGELAPNDTYFMERALAEARKAEDSGDVPVGAVVVREGTIIARAHNQRELLSDPTAHAEIVALTQAASVLGTWRLNDCHLYVTKEPCPMCAGALVNARVERVVLGARDAKGGACGSVLDITNHPRLNHHVRVDDGILDEACASILTEFFAQKRRGARADEWDGLENR